MLTPELDRYPTRPSTATSSFQTSTRIRLVSSNASTQHCRPIRPATNTPDPTTKRSSRPGSTSPRRRRIRVPVSTTSIRSTAFPTLSPTTRVQTRTSSTSRPEIRRSTSSRSYTCSSSCGTSDSSSCHGGFGHVARRSEDNVDASVEYDSGSNLGSGRNATGVDHATGQSLLFQRFRAILIHRELSFWDRWCIQRR